MVRACNFGSKDLKRIEACVIPAIKSCFNYYGFRHTSSDIEEVVSATLVKVAKSYDRYDESRSKKAWFQTIARHCACSYMSDETSWRCLHSPMVMKKTEDEVYELQYSDIECSESYHADRELNSKENIKTLKHVFDSLGDVQGKALWLQAMGYGNKELAELFGKTEGSLKTAMSRGRSQLKSNEIVLRLADEVLNRSHNKVA
ncbi:MAG: RNA polymerase sigma factor [Bacteroidales bacterium]|nr:RNA polymerase sigma factor [Bacteroidales bacterium]